MFKNILVPLDGSKLAEAAVGPAESLSKKLDAPITLLHIIEKDAPQAVHADHHLTRVDEAEEYLGRIVAQASAQGVGIRAHVHTLQVKDVAASIVQHATEEFEPDLIVMCAHGESGLRDLVFGNIAQQVLTGCQTPILLIQPGVEQVPPFTLRRILVPLDDESRHDESLLHAMNLARAYGAEVYLLTVIPTLEHLRGRDAVIRTTLPATYSALLDMVEESAREHLQGHLDEVLQSNIEANAQICRGDAVDVIVKVAAQVQADVILLGTHRKAGVGAFWARSVAPNVIKKTHIPILLIPLAG